MKFVVVFATLGCLMGGIAWHSAGVSAALSWYGTGNLVFLATVYGLQNPYLFGKRPDGHLAWAPSALNLPWLALTYATWWLQTRLSREPAWQEIPGEGLVIGRRLLPSEYPEGIDAVVDLTSELPERHGRAGYVSFPMLDAVAPAHDLSGEIRRLARRLEGKRVYVHCAQGHGRTALFCSILLAISRGVAPERAYRQLLAVRPRARMSRAQAAYLQCTEVSRMIEGAD